MSDRKDLQLRSGVDDRDERAGEPRTYASEPASRPESASVERARPAERPPVQDANGAAPLLSADQAQGLRVRWEAVQVGFVDEPRRSVEQANQLVGDAIRQLAEGFAAERQTLEQKWTQDENAVSTEDLRLALRRYRSFFDRLLCV